jgi:small subunit ribosomal protein S21
MRVKVKDKEPENFEKLLRRFKKAVERSGVLQEVKDRQHYDKPSIQRKLAKSAAIRRHQKKLKKESLPPKLY